MELLINWKSLAEDDKSEVQRSVDIGFALPSSSICCAVKQSRKICKLEFLNGAAPVVYGLPVVLNR